MGRIAESACVTLPFTGGYCHLSSLLKTMSQEGVLLQVGRRANRYYEAVRRLLFSLRLMARSIGAVGWR
jgi:hypothetical protein